MDTKKAVETIKSMRSGDNAQWCNPMHIATNCFRDGVVAKLSRDQQLSSNGSVALAEIHLSEKLPEIDCFFGIFEVDDFGLWYYDGDGGINDPIWRQRIIPWQYVKGIVLHQNS